MADMNDTHRPRPLRVVRKATPHNTSHATAQSASPDDGPVRISKLMAERGLCSRREADDFISRGHVFVDGVRVVELGTKAARTAVIRLAPEAHSHQATQVTVLIHKPMGYVSGQAEDGYQPAVVLVTPENQLSSDSRRFRREWLRGLAPAGRLDIDSTGLLILTQDGRVARVLIGDESEIEKEYLVRVSGSLDARGLALLNHGLMLDGRALKPAHVSWQNEDQLRFILTEGRKRQIRRMCELVGLRVVGLKRVRIGRIMLGDLPAGRWRLLGPGEGF
jgi:23S rRNA pseudouridine2604 synthase